MILCITVIGLHILMGFTGLVSLGQAALVGLGAHVGAASGLSGPALGAQTAKVLAELGYGVAKIEALTAREHAA